MSTSKLKATVLIAAILIVLAVIVSIATGKTVKDKTDDINPTSDPQSTVSPEPSAEPDEPDVDEPEQSEEPTQPVETPKPAESKAPVSSRTVTGSGSMSSNTGTNLNLLVKWNTVAVNDKEVSVVFDIYANCYTLNSSAKYQALKLVVDGKEYVMNAPNISSSSSTPTSVKLCSATVKMDLAEGESVSVPVSAEWKFEGTYSGVDIDIIETSGTLSIQG